MDERLKHIEPAILEKIQNEILDRSLARAARRRLRVFLGLATAHMPAAAARCHAAYAATAAGGWPAARAVPVATLYTMRARAHRVSGRPG